MPYFEGRKGFSSLPSAGLLSHWGVLVQWGPALQHLTWLMQLDSLMLSEIWLYSSSQVGNFGGRRISTESRRSRLLPAEKEGVRGVPSTWGCAGAAALPGEQPDHPCLWYPLPGTGTWGSTEVMLGTQCTALGAEGSTPPGRTVVPPESPLCCVMRAGRSLFSHWAPP